MQRNNVTRLYVSANCGTLTCSLPLQFAFLPKRCNHAYIEVV